MLEYRGGRDYGIVIELLRGNLMEPVTPPTHHVSKDLPHTHFARPTGTVEFTHRKRV